jgi:two-component sensor histidine kinase
MDQHAFTLADGRPDGAAATVTADDTAALKTALQQKTLLLHEVDHRVKNNLQLISSLVLLQCRRAAEPAVQTALRDVLQRVNAIATVHRRLFQGEDVGRFDVAEFIVDLTDDMRAEANERNIEFELKMEPVSVSSERAAPVALIVNELLSNALRHAFPDGREGRVVIELSRRNGSYCIAVTDNGVGADFSQPRPDAAGCYIVQLLARQLRAEVEWTDAAPGVRAAVTLPMNGDRAA